MNQAKALGASFGKSIRARAIFASPLVRACVTHSCFARLP